MRLRLGPTPGGQLWLVAFALAAAAAWTTAAAAPAGQRGFERWLAQLEADALARGISAATLELALSGVEPLPEIVQLDRSQPRQPRDFCSYLERRLTPTRIARGRRLMQEHRELLRQINAEYGVPERYLVALWGLETNYGDYLGEHPVVDALVTLAYDARRGELFREEVFDALRILEEGHREPDGFVGSWAGATGHMQFMPSTFLAYAVDQDGDGRKDVWSSPADALASAANYLRASGWRSGETWGRRVELPAELEVAAAELRDRLPLSAWQQRGLRLPGGGDLPAVDMRGSLVTPRNRPEPAFLVYRNYRTFLAWNRSTFFAVSVGTLADAVAGSPSLHACSG